MKQDTIDVEVTTTKPTKQKPIKAPKIQSLTVAPMNPEMLISQAIDKGVNIDVMERLLIMRQQLKAEQAKIEFDEAFSAFQGECPIITKRKKVLNKDKTSVRYVYAPLDDIVEQVKPFLQKHGFSYTIDVPHEDNWVKSVVTLTHSGGHSQQSSFKVPVDKEAYMNAQQQYASAVTFTKRYAFCNALGILTGDEDDDAQTAPDPGKKASTLDKLKDMMSHATLEQVEQFRGNVAKSKKYTDPQKVEINKLIDERLVQIKAENANT